VADHRCRSANRALVALWVAAAVGACGKPNLEGARVVTAGSEPTGAREPTLTPADCRDEHGAPVASPELRVTLMRPGAGPPLVIEERPGYGSVLVSNTFRAGADVPYAYVSRDHVHRPLLHLLWIRRAPGHSWLEIADRFQLQDAAPGFRAAIVRRTLLCSLRASDARGLASERDGEHFDVDAGRRGRDDRRVRVAATRRLTDGADADDLNVGDATLEGHVTAAAYDQIAGLVAQ
jgi:hypothetical protein